MVTIRRATLDDIPGLTQLLSQLFAQEAEFAPDAVLQAKGLAAIIGDERVGCILVAEEGGQAVALVNLLYTVSTALGGRVAILEDMVVAKGVRGQGIGGKLLEAALKTATEDGCLRVTLLTDHDNTAAHRFYGRFGFERSTMVPFRLGIR